MALQKVKDTMRTTTALDATKLSGTLPIADDSITLAHMASGTDGQVITYSAAGDPVAIGPGAAGEVLTSAGANLPQTFAAAGGGAWTLISTGTGSGQRYIDFTGLDNTYDVHVLVFNDCRVNDDAEFFNVKIGTGAGPTWEDSGYKYIGSKRLSLDGAHDYVFSDNDASGHATFKITGSTGNATGENMSGWLYCFSLASTGHKHFVGQTPSSQSGGYLQGGEFWGSFTKTNPVTGIRCYWDDGLFGTTSKIRLYGIANS